MLCSIKLLGMLSSEFCISHYCLPKFFFKKQTFSSPNSVVLCVLSFVFVCCKQVSCCVSFLLFLRLKLWYKIITRRTKQNNT